MDFRTIVPISPMECKIDYQSQLVLVGSCFAENVADKLAFYNFKHVVNPLGILFNPVSIQNLIERGLNNRSFTEEDIFYHNECWHSYEVHSEMSHSDKDLMLNSMNEALELFGASLKEASHFIITLGTSWVYKEISNNAIVANCHKVPQKSFKKYLLTVHEITESLRNIVSLLRLYNPNLSIVFTVSPVRHLKDGYVENQRSKAHLIAAVHSLNDVRNEGSRLSYFPAYEIVMDELRDYRFYSEDMIHPNSIAIDYIWGRLVESWITSEASKIMQEVEKIRKGLLHRPFNPDTDAHKKFLKQLEGTILSLQNRYPFMSF